MAGIVGNSRGSVPADTKTTYITVSAGETLWSIASRYDTRDSVQASVQWIEAHNGVNEQIQAGQKLEIPIGG